VACDADAAVAGGLRVVPHGAHLVAERRPVERNRVDDERGERDEESDVQALEEGITPEHVQLGLVRDGVRGGNGTGLARLERTTDAEEVRPDPDRDPVEHDRRDHLVGPDRPLEEAGDACQSGSGEHGPEQGQDDHEEARRAARQLGGDQHACDRAGEVLSLAADVEEPAAEGKRDGEPGEHEGRPEEQRLLEVERRVAVDARDPRKEPVQAGAVEDRPIRLERVAQAPRRQQHHHAADHEREQDREHRSQDPLRSLKNAVALDERRRVGVAGRLARELAHRPAQAAASSCPPPVIVLPSSSSVTVGGNSATTSPSNMTRMRSESERISSSSRETSRTALPSSRSSISRRWTNSIAPTSSPRVGWAATSTRGSRSISRARMTFCWLPPERAPPGVSGPPPRTSNSRIRRRAISTRRLGKSQPKRESGGLRKSWSATFSAMLNSR